MDNERMEYETFITTMSDGKRQEFAIVEEFDFEEKHYILVSEVKNDTVAEEVYLYRSKTVNDDFIVEYIDDKEEYARATAAYEAMYEE